MARDDSPSVAPARRDRQHETQADQRGEDAPPLVDGAVMAARRPGAELTIRLDQPQPPDGIAGVHESGLGLEAGLEVQDCGHGSGLLEVRSGVRTSRSNQRGETTTVAERLFDVKRKCERVFAPNA